ncbi:Histidine biosynthesis bifunctional protein HisIE [Bienertia sinuspersici]
MLVTSLRNIIITWSKASTTHSLTITVENVSDENHQTCQIDFQSCHFWSRKGLKSLNIDESERVDIFWDFKAVKFSTNPEPSSNYYVAIVSDKQVVLLLGDSKNEAYKRTMARPSPVAPTLLHKEEVLYGNNCFHTQVLLDDGPKEHNIVIENPSKRPDEPELRISIDGRVVVRVMHLTWRFRGNETVLVNNVAVQIFWDVHDWLFSCSAGSGHGLFIFKPGLLKNILDDDSNKDDRDGERRDRNEGDLVTSAAGCCHFVFAVKVV